MAFDAQKLTEEMEGFSNEFYEIFIQVNKKQREIEKNMKKNQETLEKQKK